MTIFYSLILISIIIIGFAIYNIIRIKKIKKTFDNYIFAITSEKGYYIGAVLFSLALLAITAYQAMPFISDIRILSIISFFFSIFLLSLSHLIYYKMVLSKCNDYKEFFKDFEIDLKNKCEKMMLKHIYSKENDINKIQS